VHRTELPENLGGLFGKVSIGNGQHHTGAVLEQHPRLVRVGEKALPDVDEYLAFTAIILPYTSDVDIAPTPR